MKIFLLFPVIGLLNTSDYRQFEVSSTQADTAAIIHVLDGNLAEWPGEKFTTDKATKIRYAIDNDKQTLFLAIYISDKMTQQKIIQQGMNLFIDPKGKKKENRGVQYPLGRESGAGIELMKVFGFDNSGSSPQSLKTEGTINIAIAWDSSFVMTVEYNIPLKMIEGSLDQLNNKKISIGWEINEAEVMNSNTTSQPVTSTTRNVAVPSGSRPPANRNVGPGQPNPIPPPQPSAAKTQSIWAAHTIKF